MTRSTWSVLAAAAFLAACAPAVSVQGPGGGSGQRPAPRANPSASVHVLGVPPGHLPRAGQCRVWVPGMPPGRQERSRSCRGIMATAPAGSMILYRPSRDRTIIRVHYVDNVRTGMVVVVRFFKPDDGSFLRESQPDEYRDFGDDEREEERGRGRERNDDRDNGRRRP